MRSSLANAPMSCHLRCARGSVTVEAALSIWIMLVLIFGTVEVSRAMYVFNTVQEVTRSAARMASMTDFSNAAAIAALKRKALFRDGDGGLPLVPNLGAAQLRVEYLAQAETGEPIPVVQMPNCPQQNVLNCARDPKGASCIHYVRVRICSSETGACTALPYQPMSGLVPSLTGMKIPVSSTVVKAETLGHRPGINNCI